MNIEEYISSGILEAYALGAVSDEERREVECLTSIYPQLAEALHAAQDDVEQLARLESKSPPPVLKASILNAVAQAAAEECADADANTVASADADVEADADASIIHMNAKEDPVKRWPLGWVAAAVIALGMFFANYTLRDYNAELKRDLDQISGELNEIRDQALTQQERLAVLADTSYHRIPMKGVEKSPTSLAMIYWNPTSEQVLLDVRELPKPTEDQQYQLWAIVDGTPTDLGVFDLPEGQEWFEMKSITGAVAFAVTLEPRGGRPEPALEQMYVLGAV